MTDILSNAPRMRLAKSRFTYFPYPDRDVRNTVLWTCTAPMHEQLVANVRICSLTSVERDASTSTFFL